MKSLLKTTILMGALLSGFLFSSKTTAGDVTIDIINNAGGSCAYQSFSGGEEGTTKVVGDSNRFTVTCSESFTGAINVSYSMFNANVFFEKGNFTYVTVTLSFGGCFGGSRDLEATVSGRSILINRIARETETTVTVNNLSKRSFDFKNFTCSSGVRLKDRSERIDAGKTGTFTAVSLRRHQDNCEISYVCKEAEFGIRLDLLSECIVCALNPTKSPIVVTSDSSFYGGKTVTIEDAPFEKTFTVVNKTDKDFSFKNFECQVGSVKLSDYQGSILKGETKTFTVLYPEPASDVYPAFTMTYKSGFSDCSMRVGIDGQRVVFFRDDIFPPLPTIGVKLGEDGTTITMSLK